MVEQWREIEGTNGLYEISNFGNVRSWRDGKGGRAKTPRMMKPRERGTGRGRERRELVVSLVGHRVLYIRHLMRDTWMEGQKPGYVVVHKDGDIHNVALSNLMYTTRKELCAKHKNRRKPVAKLNRNREPVEWYTSCKEAADKNFVSPSCMSYWIKTKKVYKGFRFAYDL